jgi:hypothetical protein
VDALIAAHDRSVHQANGIHDNGTSTTENRIYREELINQIMKEANYYSLASHLFWTLWAINMAATTEIKFGYMVRMRDHKLRASAMYFFLGICSNSLDCLLFNT